MGFNIRSDAEVVAPLTVTRDDAAAVTLVGVPDHPTSANASLIPGRGYALQFTGAAPLHPRLQLRSTIDNEWVRLTLPYPQATLRVVRDYSSSQPLPAAAGLAELDASTGDRYWYDGGTGLLHLKLLSRPGRTSTTLQIDPQ